MKIVKVYGALKKRLGQGRFELDVATPAEAIRALCANFPGLQKWIIDSEQDGIGYKVKVGKESIEEDTLENLHFPWSERDVFSITPVLTGAGRGFGKILIGALLIGAAVLMGPGGAWAGTKGIGLTIGSGAAKVMTQVGISLTLYGVAEMLSPVPPGPPGEAEQLESFNFSGVVNTARIGTPVPIAYGRVFVGSSVISSGLDVDQLI
jgi:predicted phage tail protein